MIELKVVDLLNAEPILVKIKEIAEKDGMSFKLAYKMKRLLDKLNSEFKIIYDQKTEIFKTFGELQDTDDGQMYKIKPEFTEQFNEVWSEFLNTDVKLNIFKLPIDELDLSDKFTLAEIAAIEPFLDIKDSDKNNKSSIKFNIDLSKYDTKG